MKPLPSLFIICVIDVLGFGILVPLVPFIAERFGATPTFVTWILGTYSACQLLAAPLWGRLSDRLGRRPILVTSMLGAACSYVLLAFAHNIAMLFLARALAGFMAGNLSTIMAYASDISQPSDRARTMGTVGAAIGVGFMIGPFIGGVLSGDQAQTASFVAPALVSTALSTLALLLVIFVLPESHTAEHRLAQAAAGPRRGPWQLLQQLPALRFLMLSSLLVVFCQSTLDSTFAIWAKDRFQAGPRDIGMVLFGLALVVVATQAGLVRRLVPVFGEMRLASVAVVSYSLGAALLAASGPLPMVIVALVLCGLGAGLFNPNASALASHEAQTHNRGAVMGAYQIGNSLGRVLAPLLAGPIYSSFGPRAPYALASLVTVQALWCLLGVRRAQQHRPSAEALPAQQDSAP